MAKCKPNTAPGPDGIKFAVLKKLPNSIFATLTTTFNHCLTHGYFPERWKKAHGRMILKPGKEKTNVRSYRPISLLNTTGKLFERILSKRLMCHFNESNFFNLWQKAYQPNKEASDILYRLTEEIKYGEHSAGKPWYTTAVSLDVEKAFDAVWHNGLRYKLGHLNLPHEICRILSSFLDNRTISVMMQSSLSKPVRLLAGTPQGSVLSPLLYLVFVNDVPLGTSNGCHAGQFADDVNLWSTSRNSRLTHLRLQNTLNAMDKWCSRWRVQMNADKTQVVTFRRGTARFPKPLEFCGKQLKESDTLTILGIKIGKTNKLRTHCKEKAAKAMQRANLLKCLRGRKWGASKETLVQLYVQYIRPILEYGAVAFSSDNNKDIKILEIAERKALRIALMVGPRTPGEVLYREANIQPIGERMKLLRTRTIERIDESSKGVQDLFALGLITGAREPDSL